MKYFVSFVCDNKNGFAYGNTVIERKNKILTFSDIQEIAHDFENKNEVTKVSIISINKL